MPLLENRAIVITGAGRGLGRAYAIDAAAEGAAVVVNDIAEAEAHAVVDEIAARGGRAVAAVESVTSWESSRRLFELCEAEFGCVDGLVNNAGILLPAAGQEVEEADARQTIEVNLLGAIFAGTHAMRLMANQGHGVIVNNTSTSAMGVTGLACYSATKGALQSLTYSWAMDMQPFGVRVNAFSPAALTRMALAVGKDRALTFPTPEQNAPAVTYLLSDLAHGITGQVIELRGNALTVVAPTAATSHRVEKDIWSARSVAEEFDPVLRANLQSLGW